MYTTIPKRKKKGLIHENSKFFYQSTLPIEVNYLRINFSNENMKIYHYDVEVPERQRTNKEIRK